MSKKILRHEAIEKGFTIDDTCNPPVAYKGPRFAPDDWFEIVQPEYVRTYFDLCTSHISRESSNWLTEQASAEHPDLVVYEYREGFFIPIPPIDSLDKIPNDLIKLLVWCDQHGASLLRLDADGFVVPGLEVHSW